MENASFAVLIGAVVVGLVLTAATLLHMRRNGGFEWAMATTPDGKWPLGRYLFAGTMASFGAALIVQIVTSIG